MPVPSLFDLTLPLLKLASEKEINYSEAADILARQFGLTPEEAAELLPSGRDRRLVNRIKWAKVELSQADLVESTRPSHFRATEAGLRQLASSPPKLDHKFLMGIPAYRARKEANRERAAAAALSGQAETEKAALIEVSGITPQEMIDQATAQIEGGLTTELLSRLADGSPTFFEKVVIDLLEAMGYGRNRPGAGLHVGGSGDGGIDGIIDQDPLGLDRVYIQAKRYGPNTPAVGEPSLRNFVGSLVGQSAQKGVFVTTGTFSSSAKAYIKTIPHRIVLIDGPELARLMVLHGVGARVEREVKLMRIDAEYFDEA